MALLLAAGTPARADLTDVVLTIQASNTNGDSGLFELHQIDMVLDPGTGIWSYFSSDTVNIMDGGVTVAILTELSLTYIADPQVTLGFSVQAGGFTTTFNITSGLLSFPTINPAEGIASAGLLVTDTSTDGATIIGLHGGGGAYLAQYNGLLPGGATFAELITSPLIATAGGTNSTNAEFPGGGLFSSIGVLVTDISAGFSFSLTADDLASGSSNFTVVPAPGGLALIAIGALGIRRRRRRN